MLESLSVLLLFLLGAAAGGAIGYRLARQRPSPEQVQEIAQLQARVLELTASNAALTATLEQERGVAAERAAELASAREQLLNSFKALSAEALQVNNEQFLNLARTQLERFQSEAKLDLAARQQQIGESLKPIRDSIGRFDAQVQEIE